jgi:cold shock CspA family protein
MAQGTITNLVTERGFGFIRPENETGKGNDLFFHRSDVEQATFEALRTQQRVTYEIGTDARGGHLKQCTFGRSHSRLVAADLRPWLGDAGLY